jgi:hemerythrin-like domain-containing protein
MSWRTILEAEHRLMLEVVEAAERECEHIEATGALRVDAVNDILGFFRFFCDGLHDPKEDGLLFSRCRKRGMTQADEPLEQMIGEHEWCTGKLDRLHEEVRRLRPGDTGATLAFAADLRDYVSVVRCHVEVEEGLFFDTVEHYLTESDLRQLTEEFESVHFEELEEGVREYWEDLAHRVLALESRA